ncbi:hypothetical protein [Porphyromonas gingivalis]|uniref:hypothetical protein n=1 Tax=Porphyromonas gingivalis TaxID=837 RepID=UPI000BE766ED|nr:hypothetical protein [Porphyromonas gingivalis]PDP64188.1 hypothetical protein CLI80_05895 [Porphyromonas gingivalis]
MANLKIVPGTTKTLFTGGVTISGKTGRIELQKAEFQDQQGKKVERFAIWNPNFPGCPFLGFTVPGAFSSLEDACHCLCEVGLKLKSNPKNQGTLIFQAKTDFPPPEVEVKIYKTVNNGYEHVFSEMICALRTPLNSATSFTMNTLEEVFDDIMEIKGICDEYISDCRKKFGHSKYDLIRYSKKVYGSTPNPDF